MRRARPVRGRGGRPLPDGLRQRLERAFGAELSWVRLHGCGSARRLTEDCATRACAVDGAVLLAPGAGNAAVLAHEVAHLLQGRLPGPRPPAPLAEAEARRAARRAPAGWPCRIAIPADPALPLAWEEAGHYYTVYFVALACGLRDPQAHRIAFWAQFPDEVSELDAVKAGFDVPGSAMGQVGHWVYEDTGIGPAAREFYAGLNNSIMEAVGFGGIGRMVPPPRRPYKDLAVNLDVQMGLHCLTGRNWNKETDTREAISRLADLGGDEFDFGLSLHSFGDSFAHRNHDTRRMYPPFLGHGPETKFVQIIGDEVARFTTGFVHPDSLGPHRLDEYREYVTRLHKLISLRFPGLKQGRDAQQSANLLSTIIVPRPDPKTQIGQIRDLANSELKVTMNAYQPERWEDEPLLTFMGRDSPVLATHSHVSRGLALAEKWARL